MACNTCFEASLPACSSGFTIITDLPDGDYFVKLTSQFNVSYWCEATATGGELAVDYGELDVALFNEHAGFYTVEIFNTMADCEAIELTFCDTVYTCILLNFLPMKGEVPDAVVQCCS